MRLYLFILATTLLTACGTRGPLVLPPGPAKPPLFGNPKPVVTKSVPGQTNATETAPATATQTPKAADNNNKTSEEQK